MKKALFLIFCLGILFSCTKKDAESPAAETSGVPPSKDKAAEQPGETITLQPTAAARREDSGPSPGTQASSKPENRNEWLLAPYLEDPIYPYDMEIGALQETGIPGEIGEIIKTANRFFLSLSQGRIDNTSVHDSAQESLKRSISYYIQNKYIPDRIRLGRVRLDGDTAKAPVRLLNEKGRALGEIIFLKTEGEWLVEDLQADFPMLAAAYKERETKFSPGEYVWIGR